MSAASEVGDLGVVDADVDDAAAAAAWSASGAQWLTDPAVAVPGGLVRRVLGLVRRLDAAGAGLAELVPGGGLGLLAERAASMGLPPSGLVSSGGATRLVRCRDGWAAVSLPRSDDRELIPAWLECGAPIDEATSWTTVESGAATSDVVDVVGRGAMLGLPVAGVGECDDVRDVLAERVGSAVPRPLHGSRVINLSALWAGPLCADVLARLGARVICVESTRRPDGGRAAASFFHALHGRSESVALDLTMADGRASLRRLIATADVVIEGSRPRALEQMGIDPGEVVAAGARVWLSITGHGRSGVAGHRVGFGDDTAAAGGLVGWTAGEPRLVADAVADPLTGLTAAAAIVELLGRGDRWIVDVALARVARSVVGGWCVPSGSPPAPPRRRADPGGPMPLGRDTDRVLAEC